MNNICEFPMFHKVSDFSGSDEEILKKKLERILSDYGCWQLKTPIHSIVRELVLNGLKAVYKKIFFQYLVQDIGIEDVSYHEWLSLFRTEIETNSADNFSRICREQGMEVIVSFFEENAQLIIKVTNAGVPSQIELKRIREALELGKKIENFNYLLHSESVDKAQESAGLGLPLVLMTIRGLGLSPDSLFYRYGKEITSVFFNINLGAFREMRDHQLPIIDWEQEPAYLIRLFNTLDLGIVRFSIDGKILSASGNFIEQFIDIPTIPVILREIFPKKFFEDIFFGRRKIQDIRKFENYRIFLENPATRVEILYNISGYVENDIVHTLWQKVNLDKVYGSLSEGNLQDNARSDQLSKKYISATVMKKVRESANSGQWAIPSEFTRVSVLYTDLLCNAILAGKEDTEAILQFFNTCLGIASRSTIKNQGRVDRFFGDSIFSLFEDPLQAVIAAVEMQNIFQQMNSFRAVNGEGALNIRFGIYTGSALIGNVDTGEKLDWSVVGDSLNHALVIGKNSGSGRLCICEKTRELCGDNIKIFDDFEIGENHMHVFSVKSVRFSFLNSETILKMMV